MASYDGEVRINSKLDTKDLEKGLKTMQSKLATFTNKISKSIQDGVKKLSSKVIELSKKAVTTAVTSLTAMSTAAIAFGRSAVAAFSAAEEAAAQLNKMLLNTGSSQGSIDKLIKTIDELSSHSVLANDNLTAMAKQLSTFDMSAEGIAQLLPVLADMAVAEKGLNASMEDYIGIAQMMGKAVQGDVSGLSRMGFIIEKDVIDAIKNTTSEEKRLQLISEILGRTYTDMASAMKESFAGQQQIFQNIWNGIKQAFGGSIANTILQPLLADLNKNFGEVDWKSIFGNDAQDGIINGLYTFFLKAFESLPSIIAGLDAYAHVFVTAINDFFNNLDGATAAPAIKNFVNKVINTFGDTFIGTFDQIAKHSDRIVEILTSWLQTILDKLPDIVSSLFDALIALATSSLGENEDGLAASFVTSLTRVFDIVVQRLPELITVLDKAFNELFAKVFAGLSKNLEESGHGVMASLFSVFSDFFAQNPSIIEDLLALASAITALSIAFKAIEIAKTIGEVVGTVTTFLEKAELVKNAIDGITLAMGFLAANPIVLTITAIVAAIALVAAAFVYLWNHSEKFRQFWYDLWDGVKVATQKVVDWFKRLPDDFRTVFGFFSGLFKQIGEALSGVWDGVKAWVFEKKRQLAEWWETLQQNVSSAIDAVVQFFAELPGRIWAWLVVAWENISTWCVQTYTKMSTAISETIDAVVKYFSELPGKIWTWLKETYNKCVRWLSEMYDKISTEISNLCTTVINFFQELPGKVWDVGVKIVHGLWDGIQSAKDWLLDRIGEFVNGIVDGAKDALGIHSPSRVFAEIGKYTALGLGDGFGEQMATVREQFRREVRALIAEGQASTAISSGLSNGSTAYAYNNTFNFNAPTVSPYELERALRRSQQVR